jgi:hypothetical protein
MFICLSFFRISKRSPFLVKSAIFPYSCAHCARVDLFIVATRFFLLPLTHALPGYQFLYANYQIIPLQIFKMSLDLLPMLHQQAKQTPICLHVLITWDM